MTNDDLLQEHKKRMAKIKRQNTEAKYRAEEEAERQKFKPKKKKITASKLALFVMLMVCLEIILFAEYVMYHTGDLSALITLIGIPASMAVVIWSYYSKSKAENTRNGIVYETAMRELDNDEEEGVVG